MPKISRLQICIISVLLYLLVSQASLHLGLRSSMPSMTVQSTLIHGEEKTTFDDFLAVKWWSATQEISWHDDCDGFSDQQRADRVHSRAGRQALPVPARLQERDRPGRQAQPAGRAHRAHDGDQVRLPILPALSRFQSFPHCLSPCTA